MESSIKIKEKETFISFFALGKIADNLQCMLCSASAHTRLLKCFTKTDIGQTPVCNNLPIHRLTWVNHCSKCIARQAPMEHVICNATVTLLVSSNLPQCVM